MINHQLIVTSVTQLNDNAQKSIRYFSADALHMDWFMSQGSMPGLAVDWLAIQEFATVFG